MKSDAATDARNSSESAPDFSLERWVQFMAELLESPDSESAIADLTGSRPSDSIMEALCAGGLEMKNPSLDAPLACRLITMWESRLHRRRVAAEGWKVSTESGDRLAAMQAIELSSIIIQAFSAWRPEVFESIAATMYQFRGGKGKIAKLAVPMWGSVAREVVEFLKRDGSPEPTKAELRAIVVGRMRDRVGRDVAPPAKWDRVWKSAGLEGLASAQSGPAKGSGGRPRKGRVAWE